MKQINKIRDRLLADEKENDHYTVEPMFCLQILVRDAGFDAAYADNKCWYSPQLTEVAYDDDEGFPDLDDEDGWDGPFGYRDRWETVMIALTQEGIDDYMRQNGHNVKRRAFRGETRTFVESFNRCQEMMAVRKFLMDGQG